jgi:tRNA(adenine34) deaminase
MIYPEPKYALDEMEAMIADFTPKAPHDGYAIVALQEAIAAAREGNWGVGACLVDPNEKVALRGHNRFYSPYFRSDMHAEMNVMTRWEDAHPELKGMKGYVLFTSLEPCPMCTARLMYSGVTTVFTVSPDVATGLASHLDRLGPIWQEMAGELFQFADCSPLLRELGEQVFFYTANDRLNKQDLRRATRDELHS